MAETGFPFLCFACRTLLPTGARCDCGGARSFSLADPGQREGLLHRILVERIVRNATSARYVPVPRGAEADPRIPPDCLPIAGHVEAASRGQPVARGVRLFWETELMLRHAAGSGFRVRLAEGRVLDVPAGRLRLFVEPDDWTPLSKRQCRALKRELDPMAKESRLSEWEDPFPCDRGESRSLAVGDRVEVLSPLIPTFEGGPVSYREVALGAQLRGVPMLRATR